MESPSSSANSSEEAKLKQEVKLLREVLAKCLKARQINHVRQIIKEVIK